MKSLKTFLGWGSMVLAIVLISALIITVVQAQSTTFTNPLNTTRGADPWMTYYNGRYYLTATTWSSDPNVGITMKSGATIAELKAATPQRIFFDTTSNRCCNIWAPEFHLMNGPNGQRWYLYYVAGVAANTDSQRLYVAESAGLDPMGPYTYKGQLAVGGPTDAWAVDPTIMTINGSYYLFYSAYEGAHYSTSQNIYGVALSNPWTVSGSPVLIARPTWSWETGTAAVNEAPVQLTAPNGTIYLVFSATWCGNPNYQLGRATYNGGNVLSQSSWVKYNGAIFTHGSGQSSTAHNGFFKSPDGTEDWVVYHGVDNTNGDCGATNRTTRIQKFTWNSDNTPNMGTSIGSGVSQTVPSGEGGGGGPTPTRTNTPTTGPTFTPTRTNTPGPTPTATNTPIPGAGPIVLYTFDGNGNDTSGNGKNATVTGGTYVTGKKGQAVNLNGTSSQYITLPAGVVSGLSDFSISTWVKLTSIGNWQRIFDFGSSTTINMFLTSSMGSHPRFAITTSGNGAEQQLNPTAALATGSWVHIVITRSGNTATIYVNGASVATNASMTLSPSSMSNTTNNWIGRSQYSGDPYLNAAVDEFRIYNRALTVAEVQALYQTP